MVIGSGLLASRFSEFKNLDFTIFASGISNSNEINKKIFKREENLLLESLKKEINQPFVYFSSCDIENSQLNKKPYYQHKLNMENIIKISKRNYYIFRLPQIIAKGGNSNTLFNFLLNKIKKNETFEVWQDTKKNILDIDDTYVIAKYILKHTNMINTTCNIINTQYISIIDLVKIIEKTIGKKANYTIKDLNTTYYYNSECIDEILKYLDIKFDEKYFEKIIKKYTEGRF